jgi:hypothetical protein
MNTRKLTSLSLFLIAIISTLTLFNSCKKSTNYSSGNTTVFDNSKTTQGTIYGQVVNEDGTPLADANVRVGANSYTTDKDGIFYFSKITTQQNATLVTVTKNNYFTGYRTLRIQTNKDHYAKIMMIEMKNAATFNSITGGTVNVNGGGTITFPANGIAYKSNGTPYNGTVTMYSKWLDPTSNTLNQMMPGDLRAIDANNAEKILQTFGMMGVELFDNSGTALQIASGKTAKMSFPIPSSISVNAPNSIPLWSFDAVTGMWKEEGSATKQGSNYVGDVKHFSFWNCDVPNNFIQLDMTLTDNFGVPLANNSVKITNPATGSFSYGYTNSAGFVSGYVPDNAILTLEVLAPLPCTNVIHSQTVTTTSANLSLGTIAIVVPAANNYTFTGTVLDCSGNPVTSGFVSISANSSSIMVPTNSLGVFNASMILCASTATASVTAYDLTANVNDNVSVTINSGANNLGNLNACSNLNAFINWSSTVGAVTNSFSVTEPTDVLTSQYSPTSGTFIYGYSSGAVNVGFNFDGLDNTTGSHNIISYYDNVDSITTIPTPIPVTLTNYQPAPGYIEGSFTGIVSGTLYPVRTITCNFRVKR